MRLAELQRNFAHAMLAGDNSAVAATLTGAPELIPERLEIYRNNVFASLHDVLKNTFPACLALVGDGFFMRLAYDYIRANPPGKACLLYFGGGFPVFINGYEAAASVAYLGDVARLEWALHEAGNAPDEILLAEEEVSEMDDAALRSLRIGRAGHVRLLESRWPVDDIHAYTQAPDGPAPDMAQGDFRLAVWRGADHRVYSARIGGGVFAALDLLGENASFSDSYHVLAAFEQHTDAPTWLAQALGRRWLKRASN